MAASSASTSATAVAARSDGPAQRRSHSSRTSAPDEATRRGGSSASRPTVFAVALPRRHDAVTLHWRRTQGFCEASYRRLKLGRAADDQNAELIPGVCMPAQADIEHLLRRTEFVARPGAGDRADREPTLDAAVDNILAVPTDPGIVHVHVARRTGSRARISPTSGSTAWRCDSPRPIQEKMAFFWHGHFCSEFGKVGSAELMREQIDLFRTRGLGNLAHARDDDVDAGGDDPLPRQQRQPQVVAEPELRPRADGAVPARRRQLHRGRRRGVDRGLDRPHRQLGDRRVRVARRLARQRHRRRSSAGRSTPTPADAVSTTATRRST